MSQIDMNIIEPLPYLQIMEGVGPRGEKGDKGDPGEVSQAVFDELDSRESSHYNNLTSQISTLTTTKANASDVKSIKDSVYTLAEGAFEIRSFGISTDGSNFSEKVLVPNGTSIGAVYVDGEFTLRPNLVTDYTPGEVEIKYGTTDVTLPINAPMLSNTFGMRYVAPNVIRTDVTAILTTYIFGVPYDFLREAYIKFVDTLHYGVASAGSLTDSFLLSGLSTHTLSETKEVTFTVTAGTNDYIWFALPTSYGTPTFMVSGVAGGFRSMGTFRHTNRQSYSTTYELWRSDNKALGETTVTVV